MVHKYQYLGLTCCLKFRPCIVKTAAAGPSKLWYISTDVRSVDFLDQSKVSYAQILYRTYNKH